jgi:hypothetical protein
VDVARCDNEKYVDATRKGALALPVTWAIDGAVMAGDGRTSGFESRLADFGYRHDGLRGSASLSVKRYQQLGRISAGPMFAVEHLTMPGFTRDTELEPLTFNSTTTLLGPGAALHVHLSDRIAANAEATVSLAVGRSRFSDQDANTTTETFFGVGGSALVGLSLEGLFGTRAQLNVNARATYAGAIENDIGDSLDSGGLFFGVGIGYQIGATQ